MRVVSGEPDAGPACWPECNSQTARAILAMLTPLGTVEDHVTTGRSWAAARPSCPSVNASPSYRSVRLDHRLNTIRMPRVAGPSSDQPIGVDSRDSHCLEQGACHERPQAAASSRGTRSAPSGEL